MYKRNHKTKGQAIVEYLLLLSFVVLIMLKVGSFIQNSFKKGAPILKEVVIEQNLETGVGFK
ncbi:MAG: hypothetical protein A2Z91_03180 [Deltaproteobacteria bacterium GWA2_38_16]|nr:MAG: hypothetical protein A2Z91_03180 [Deltaproteobacteria bacterium GWA2_38_16]OGQ02888.1 MAG: hypothetical protein A3D19_06605 [Deltaproteobacteria bacterium RIFCSPHIGHO2_02_FULL_38_15]OGQ35096.1 MAG: hypothetical protein A3A72_03575 [Deltaproteobacteria bacterium RIFCSPLOWO2_01_FULL_38_9]OGQ63434.1 MAG: hypothetical protein A3G92_07080 [Deltaproteobacteria bacterium RIFCSPLOWO2_12_FULL_38_8]HBQ21735.1 hypothetical protein [Deltaproteobacteria bacterium]